MLLEQNAVPGLTNRMLARVRARGGGDLRIDEDLLWRARRSSAAIPFAPSSSRRGTRSRTRMTSAVRRRVLVFGGSQGAHAINVAMVEAASALANMGAATSPHPSDRRARRGHGPRRVSHGGTAGQVEPFLYDMGRRLAQADLIVCRAGATTLAELTAAGKPSILIPLPTATDDHQRKNAEALAAAGAAEMMLQTTPTGPALAARIRVARDDARGADADERGRRARLARPDAAKVIVDRALELADARVLGRTRRDPLHRDRRQRHERDRRTARESRLRGHRFG